MKRDLSALWGLARKYLKERRGAIFVGIIASFIFSIAKLATPFVTKIVVDLVFLGDRMDLLVPLGAISALILSILLIMGYVSNYLIITAFESVKSAMRHDLFKHLLDASVDFLSMQRSGEVAYRIFSDSQNIVNYCINALLTTPIDVIFATGIMVILFLWKWPLAVVLIATSGLHILVIVLFRNPLLRYAVLKKNTTQKLMGFVVERFRSAALLKISATEELETRNFMIGLTILKKINIKSFMINKLSEVFLIAINNFWWFIIIIFGGRMVLTKEITLGTLMAFLLLAGRIHSLIGFIVKVLLSFQDVRASLLRFLEYSQIEPAVIESPRAVVLKVSEGRVEFKNVWFGYTPKKPVLMGLSIIFEPNKITAIVGKTGSGKSTIARLIVRLFDPWKGKVMIDGIDIRHVTLESLRTAIKYVPTSGYVLSGTIWNNICYGTNICTKREVIAAVKKVNLHSWIEQLPEKFNTAIGEGGLQLSSGEAQRIALARLFLSHPKIAILDEPTSFLDPETEKIIHQALFELKRFATVIIIAHRPSTVKIADRIVVLNGGVVVEEGTHEELIGKKGLYTKLFNELCRYEKSYSGAFRNSGSGSDA